MPAPRKYPMELRRRAIDEVIARGRKVADVTRPQERRPARRANPLASPADTT